MGDIADGAPEDLSSVLIHVAANARPSTRSRIVNSSETRGFLAIGLQLLQEDLLEHQGPDLDSDDDSGTRLFSGLSQSRLIERAERADLGRKQPMRLTVGMYRDRWRYKSQFTEDLISYVFRPGSGHKRLDAMRSYIGQELARKPPLGDLVRGISEIALDATLDSPMHGLQTILQVAIPNHPNVQRFLQEHYGWWLPRWIELFKAIATVYELELREGWTWMDVAELLTVVMDGVRLRSRAAHAPARLSSGEVIQGAAIAAMLPTLFCRLEYSYSGGLISTAG